MIHAGMGMTMMQKGAKSGVKSPARLTAFAAAMAAIMTTGAARADVVEFTLNCIGGPNKAATYVYHINLYKRSVQMEQIVDGKTIKDPNFLLAGKRDTSVRLIDDKVMMSYVNEAENTFTIVLPIYGGPGNMRIGNIEGEKDHPDGYALTCSRK